MGKSNGIKLDIIESLTKDTFEGDLGDIGNAIGIAIGDHISGDMGFELSDFISGIKHGVSLVDGTHG